MKKSLLLLLMMAVAFTAASQEYIITGYGVGTDSTKLNTVPIQKLIDKAESNGGGTIVIPKGVFLTGALFFKPKTKLLLQQGAVLKGSDDISNYPLIPSRMEGRSIYYYAALINAYHVDSFQITGPGTIDGNGLRFWEYFWFYRDSVKKLGRSATNLEVHRPRLLFIWGCNNVTIQNVKLHNSGFWTTHLYQCTNVLIENCDIRSPFKPVKAPSTDGIDIDVCKKVTIRKCYISVNDDAVCIKGGKGPDAHLREENGIVEDILIEDCVFGESHGTLTLGSECIHARNITMRNCRMEHNTSILRLKMRPDTYQVYENIRIENITGKCGTIISMAPWTQFYDMGGSAEKPYASVRNISFNNINVQCKTVGAMQGNPADTVADIFFNNSNITAETPELKTSYTNIKFDDVTVNAAPFNIAGNSKTFSKASGQLKLHSEHKGPVINSKHVDVIKSKNKSGFETGQVIKYNNIYHMFVNEMFDRPHRDLRIAYWTSSDAITWKRQLTIVNSIPGRTATNPRSEVWVSSIIYNEEENAWNIFYVAYRAGDSTKGELQPNDYEGKIWRAMSVVKGRDGIAGPYADMEIVLQPGKNSQPWEGQQAVASFFPYQVNDKWYAMYDGHNHLPKTGWPTGMAFASKLNGPWLRMPEGFNPLNVVGEFMENAVVSKLKDGRYMMVFDSFGDQEIGYSLSADGVHWDKEIRVKIQTKEKIWAQAGDHFTRTPLCAIEEDDGTFTVVYTAMTLVAGKRFYAVGKCTLAWQ